MGLDQGGVIMAKDASRKETRNGEDMGISRGPEQGMVQPDNEVLGA